MCEEACMYNESVTHLHLKHHRLTSRAISDATINSKSHVSLLVWQTKKK